MYRRFLRTFYRSYYSSADFRKWQNNLTRKLYATLLCNVQNNEVTTVKDLCHELNNEKYEGLSISTEKIHGSTSKVSFDYMGNPTSRELADMVIISLITFDSEILMLKVALIQNKKFDKGCTDWSINQEQLYTIDELPHVQRTFTQNRQSAR